MAMTPQAVWIGCSTLTISHDVGVVWSRDKQHRSDLVTAVMAVSRTASEPVGSTSNGINNESKRNGEQWQ